MGPSNGYHAINHTEQDAERLDLDMAFFSSTRWSLAGGPWVKPEQVMKKLVWSDTTLEGPHTFSGILTPPPTVNGPIRNKSHSRLPQSDPK